MKTQRNIFIAFILNLAFSLFEFWGGIFTGSVAIISDAIHDMGDAASIGLSYFLEKKSKRKPDSKYTYGYSRYSVLGGLITTVVLFVSSIIMIANAINRIITPTQIHYNGMILFAIVGVCVNFFAAIFTREGCSINQKAVNLHMLEDVMGWLVVLIGAVVMRFTDFALIDPIMSIGVSVFILVHAAKTLKVIMDLFLEKIPHNIEIDDMKAHLEKIDGVLDVHHIHIRSIDGQSNLATMHVVTDYNPSQIKKAVREELLEHGIMHATIEIENSQDACQEMHCQVASNTAPHAHAHAHHHHH